MVIYATQSGAIAQLGERIPCTDEVVGSIPTGSTILKIQMKKIIILSFLYLPLSLFAEVTLEEKIEFIISSELSPEVMESFMGLSKGGLEVSGIDSEDLDTVLAIMEPYFDRYLDKIKDELKTVYMESFTPDEINSYYLFVSSSTGKSFMKKMPLLANKIMEISFSMSQEMLDEFTEDMIKNPDLFEGIENFGEMDSLMDPRNPLIENSLDEIENNKSCAYCNLSFVSLVGRNLDGVDFSGADLQGTIFSNSSLIGASFVGSNLVDTIFQGSDLTGSNFYDSTIESADFRNATIKDVNFEDAEYLCNAMFSDGTRNFDC